MKVDSPAGPLWFLIDSGDMRGVLVSPHAAKMLGLSEAPADTGGVAVPAVTLDPAGPSPPDTVTATVIQMIHDGAVGRDYIASRVWMLDLASGRAWVRPAPRTNDDRGRARGRRQAGARSSVLDRCPRTPVLSTAHLTRVCS
jgi:hypothetical protein